MLRPALAPLRPSTPAIAPCLAPFPDPSRLVSVPLYQLLGLVYGPLHTHSVGYSLCHQAAKRSASSQRLAELFQQTGKTAQVITDVAVCDSLSSTMLM